MHSNFPGIRLGQFPILSMYSFFRYRIESSKIGKNWSGLNSVTNKL